MLCTKCGAILNDRSQFCNQCGRAVGSKPTGVNGTHAATPSGPGRESWKFVVPIVLVLGLSSVFAVFLRRRSVPNQSQVTANATPEGSNQQQRSSSSSSDTGWKPFDANVSSLPAHYEGLDPEKLCNAVRERQVKKFKGAYESTAEHQNRVEALDKEPVIGEVSVDSTVALPAQILEARFDADREKLTIEVDLDDSVNISYTIKNRDAFRGFLSKGVGSKKPSYTGTNAFGLQVQVTPTENELYEVLFSKKLPFRFERYEGHGISQLVFRLSANKVDAPELQKNLRVLAVGRLRKPYIQDWDVETKPTITKPEEEKDSYHYIFAIISEFWLYDSRNGKILQRMKADGRSPS